MQGMEKDEKMSPDAFPSLENLLDRNGLIATWDGQLSGWENATDTQRQVCRDSVATLRDQFMVLWQDVPDESERQGLLSIFYLQLKSHWILLQTQVSYQIEAGHINQEIFYRSGLLSHLLGVIEPLLPPGLAYNVGDFLARLVNAENPAPGDDATNSPAPLDMHRNDEELAQLRAERSYLLSVTGQMSVTDAANYIHRLQDGNAELFVNVARLEASHALLERELKLPSIASIINEYQTMEARLSELEPLLPFLGGVDEALAALDSLQGPDY